MNAITKYYHLTDEELKTELEWVTKDLEDWKRIGFQKLIASREYELSELKKECRYREIRRKLEKGESL